ncbi:MAG: AtpZ/AtpI family protein [Pseudomonadota bacterium]
MPKDLSSFAAYGIYGAAGLQLAISVVAFLFIGDYADEKLGTSPWLTVTGLILGFIGGMVNLIKIVKRINIGGEPKDKT